MSSLQSSRQTEKKRLENLLFAPQKDGELPKKLPPSDIVRFLQLAGKNHRKGLFHYTKVDSLESIVLGRSILLSRGLKMNDLCEFKSCDPALWERAYVLSFSHGPQECVAMWKMYGEGEESGRNGCDSVRIRFPVGDMAALAEGLVGRKVAGFNSESKTFSKELFPIKSASLHDVMYRSGRHIEWNGLHAGTSRCEAFEDARKERQFATYVKDAGWSYERETRLVVLLDEPCDYTRIVVPLDGIVEDLEILLGPCAKAKMKNKEKRVAGICRKSGLELKIERSEYEVEWK